MPFDTGSEAAVGEVPETAAFTAKEKPRPALPLVVHREHGGSAARALATFANVGVVCLLHSVVAASLSASVTPTAAPWPTWSRSAGFAYGAEHVARIRRGVRHGPRPDAGSRSGMSGKGHSRTYRSLYRVPARVTSPRQGSLT
jgi:hypothetical protein